MSLAGYWEFPGGKAEENETAEAAIQREIHEELSLIVKADKFLADAEFEAKGKNYILKAYRCEIISGEINLKEHSDYKWCNPEEFSNYQFPPPDLEIIEKLWNK